MIRLAVRMALLLAAPGTLVAQVPAVLRGQVLDASTGAPVEGARLELGGLSTISGADGRFEFRSLPAGRGDLRVQAIGYRPQWLPLRLDSDAMHDRVVRLVASLPTLPEVVIQGYAADPALDHATLVRRGDDLATAIDGWQGVVVRRSGGNGPASPQVRGSAPEEVIVLVDGFAINDPLTGRADLSQIPTRDLASVQVRPGARSAGGAGVAVGGVIDIRSQAPSSGAAASGWMGSHGSGGASVVGTVAGTRLFLRGERLADGFSYRVPPNRGGGEAARLNAGGTVGSLAFRTSGSLTVQGRASVSRRGLPGAVGNETPTAAAEDVTAFIGVSSTGSMGWAGSVQYLQSDVGDPAPPTGPAYQVRSAGWSATLDWARRGRLSIAGWDGDVEVGVSGRHDAFGGDVVREDTRFTRGGIRAGATARPAPGSPWTLAASARVDRWTGESGPLGSARLDGGWSRHGTSIRASFGSAVAAPALADLFFREGVGVALNPGLRPERVRWETVLGVNQDWSMFGRPATASVHGYYGRVDDMILWAPGVGFIWSPRNFDVIRRGLDAAVSLQPVRRLLVELQGAMTPITYDVPDGAQVQYRPVGTWSASAAWTGAGWAADARWRWVGERFPNPGGLNPRPSYGVLNAGLEKSIGPALVRGEVRDLFDERAEFLAGYPAPGRTAVLSISMEWQ